MSSLVEVYTESTPNPETLKFVCSVFLLKGAIAEFKKIEDTEMSPFAAKLFEMPFVQSVFIQNHVATVTKKSSYEWFEISPEIRQNIKQFLESGQVLFNEKFYQQGVESTVSSGDGETIEEKISALLDKYVKPAVEMDGGHIAFKSYDNGIVYLSMQGACSGCPSSSITLKNGIEGLLKRMIPEVKEVLADQD